MDLVLSLMPIKLIRSLHRSTSEKILIGILMALGLLATGVACGKMTTFDDFGKGDPMQATIRASLLAKLEEVVGIIATSLPCLKSPAEQALRKLGIVKEHQLTTPSFVNSVPLPNLPMDHAARSDSEGSLPTKGDIRVDSVSVSVQLGSSHSNTHSSNGPRKEGWEAV